MPATSTLKPSATALHLPIDQSYSGSKIVSQVTSMTGGGFGLALRREPDPGLGERNDDGGRLRISGTEPHRYPVDRRSNCTGCHNTRALAR
jgi:hypothetical protein